jgi:hypothetical protein
MAATMGFTELSTAFASQDTDLKLGIRSELCDAFDEGGAHPDTNGIDRGIVDPDDSDVAALFESALHVFLRWKQEA